MMRRTRNGLSLLEVIISIAILGGSLTVIGQLVRLGVRNAVDTGLTNTANILADTKMAELAAGVIDLESAGPRPVEEDTEWVYEVETSESEQLGLLTVKLTVSQARTVDPVNVVIHRFLPDPDYDPATEETE